MICITLFGKGFAPMTRLELCREAAGTELTPARILQKLIRFFLRSAALLWLSISAVPNKEAACSAERSSPLVPSMLLLKKSFPGATELQQQEFPPCEQQGITLSAHSTALFSQVCRAATSFKVEERCLSLTWMCQKKRKKFKIWTRCHCGSFPSKAHSTEKITSKRKTKTNFKTSFGWILRNI